MTELSDDLKRLIADARVAHDPDDAAQQRVKAALAATLATGVVTSSAVVSLNATQAVGSSASVGASAAIAKGAVAGKLVALKVALWTGVSIAVVVGGAWVAMRPPSASDPAADVRQAAAASSLTPRVQNELIVDESAAESSTASQAHEETKSMAQAPVPVPSKSAKERRAPGRGGNSTATQRAGRAHASSRRVPQPQPGAAKVDTVEHAAAASEAVAPPSSTELTQPSTERPSAALAVGMPGLGEELALIQRATAAVGSRDYRQALSILAEHGQRFPAGALSEERAGLRTVCRCALGQADAPAAAQRFASRYPESTLLARVRAACEELP